MSMILDSVRGTVQGVLSGVGHVLWYVDWQTGGGPRGLPKKIRPDQGGREPSRAPHESRREY